MRRHLSPVAVILILLLTSRAGFSQEAPPVPANRVRGDVVVGRALFASDLSVVGSDGIFYRVRHDFGILSLPVGPAVVPPPPSSILEAIDLNPNSNRPVDSIAFPGVASQLGIGKDNRLYLVVNVTPPVSIAERGTTNLVPVPPPKSRLYIIPTPFPPRVLGATIESVVVPVSAIAEGSQSLDSIVQVDFDGHVQSLKVKAVGDSEYVYLSSVIPPYRFPTLSSAEDAGSRLAPIKPLVKLLIFNNQGRKIKEVDTE